MYKILGITLAVTIGTVAGTFSTERITAVKAVWRAVDKVEQKIEWCGEQPQADLRYTPCEKWAETYINSNIPNYPQWKILVAPVKQLELSVEFLDNAFLWASN